MITTKVDRAMASQELARIQARIATRERELEHAATRGADVDTDSLSDLWDLYDSTVSRTL